MYKNLLLLRRSRCRRRRRILRSLFSFGQTKFTNLILCVFPHPAPPPPSLISPATQHQSFLATNLLLDFTHLYASLSSIVGFASNRFLAASAIWMSSGRASSPTSLFSGIFMAIVIELPEICLSSPRKTEPNVPLPRNLPRVMWDAWIFRFGAISSNIWKCKNINSGLDAKPDRIEFVLLPGADCGKKKTR